MCMWTLDWSLALGLIQLGLLTPLLPSRLASLRRPGLSAEEKGLRAANSYFPPFMKLKLTCFCSTFAVMLRSGSEF